MFNQRSVQQIMDVLFQIAALVDRAEAGSGVLGDLGSHWIDLALYLLGPITHIGAVVNSTVPRAPRADGAAYDLCEDVAMMTVPNTYDSRQWPSAARRMCRAVNALSDTW